MMSVKSIALRARALTSERLFRLAPPLCATSENGFCQELGWPNRTRIQHSLVHRFLMSRVHHPTQIETLATQDNAIAPPLELTTLSSRCLEGWYRLSDCLARIQSKSTSNRSKLMEPYRYQCRRVDPGPPGFDFAASARVSAHLMTAASIQSDTELEYLLAAWTKLSPMMPQACSARQVADQVRALKTQPT